MQIPRIYREWYARVFREWGTCGGSILLEATFEKLQNERDHLLCLWGNFQRHWDQICSVNQWVNFLMGWYYGSIGKWWKAGGRAFEGRHLEACPSGCIFPWPFLCILNYSPHCQLPTEKWHTASTGSFNYVLPKHMGPVTVLISMKTMFLFIPSFVYSRHSATAQSKASWFRGLPLSPLPVNEGVPLGYVSGIRVAHYV